MMQGFEHINAESVEGAVSTLRQYAGKAIPLAGGTDILGGLRASIYHEAPSAVINLKNIRDLHYIQEENGSIRIGSMITLTELMQSSLINEKCPLLAAAASRTASTLLRNCGTLGGNVCQENRCWYYRYPNHLGGRMLCVRKGGDKCFAVKGDSRYHSIFGAVKRCIAVNPSDMAPALMALDAQVKTSERILHIRDFFSAENGQKSTVLFDDEILMEFVIPISQYISRTSFQKFSIRKSIDFAIANCAVYLSMELNKISYASISINAVYPNPIRAEESEEFLIGKEISESIAHQAAELSVARAKPLPMNRYKVQIAKTLVKDAIINSN